MTTPGAEAALRFAGGVTLVGGGALERADLEEALARAPYVVAADGGANRLADWGMGAAAVVGDMDSLADPEGWRARGAAVVPVAEQDTTDLEKCLMLTEAPFYLGVGFTGLRFDHTLAALHALLRFPDKRLVLLAEAEAIFLAPLDWRARLAPGARVSFFPLAPTRGLDSAGLAWPLRDLDLAAGVRIGTSNRAAEADVAARFDRRGVAAMVERRFLDAALESLS
jgi:thiamine pyrophosphokinase